MFYESNNMAKGKEKSEKNEQLIMSYNTVLWWVMWSCN